MSTVVITDEGLASVGISETVETVIIDDGAGAPGPPGPPGPPGGGGGLPVGGALSQALVKQSGVDGDADWETLIPSDIGIPLGGTIGEVLAKASSTDNDFDWIAPPSGTGGLPAGGAAADLLVKQSGVDGDALFQAVTAVDVGADPVGTAAAGDTAILDALGTAAYLNVGSTSSDVASGDAPQTAVDALPEVLFDSIRAPADPVTNRAEFVTEDVGGGEMVTSLLGGNLATLDDIAASGGGDMLSTNNLSDLANAGTARTNLGLGTAAVAASGAFEAAGVVATHSADTTAVHGIADTSLLETATGAQTKVDTHSADTTSVHGIADTTLLETATGAQAKVDTHSADTTAVHGIADTTALVLTGDARLSDARTPTAHKTSHENGGADELALDASQITTGTHATARLGTGTANSSTFLRGDQTWAAPAGGGGGDLLAANNLSDLASAPTARTNLGLEIETDVPGYPLIELTDFVVLTAPPATIGEGALLVVTFDQTLDHNAGGFLGPVPSTVTAPGNWAGFTNPTQTFPRGIISVEGTRIFEESGGLAGGGVVFSDLSVTKNPANVAKGIVGINGVFIDNHVYIADGATINQSLGGYEPSIDSYGHLGISSQPVFTVDETNGGQLNNIVYCGHYGGALHLPNTHTLVAWSYVADDATEKYLAVSAVDGIGVIDYLMGYQCSTLTSGDVNIPFNYGPNDPSLPYLWRVEGDGAVRSQGQEITVGHNNVVTDGLVKMFCTPFGVPIAGMSVYKDATDAFPVAGLFMANGVGSWGLGPGGGTGTDVNCTRTGTAAATAEGSWTFEDIITGGLAPRVTSLVSNATWSINSDTTDIFVVTAQAVAATTIANPTGTPLQGQRLFMRIKDDGTSKGLTWSGTQWRHPVSGATLPGSTIGGDTLYLQFTYNATDTKWDLVGVTTYDKNAIDVLLLTKQPLDADLTAIAANPARARETTIVSSATWSPNADTTDIFTVTAQAVAATTIANPSGTPVQGQKLVIRVTDDGGGRVLTWSGTQWRSPLTGLPIPTQSLAGQTLYMEFTYNATDTKWDLTGTSTYDKTALDFLLAAKQPLDADLTAIAALADPNADRLLFWDDSAGAYTYLTPGTNLTITGTTLDAAGASGAPTTVDYLVGTADGGLSNEIVVGTTPGGELGGTWASPTVDATHSGSSHAAVQAAAEATAAAALTAHTGDTSDAHDASAISILDTAADFTATDVEGALAELQTADEADEAALAAHLADATDAHDASAISFTPDGSIAATTVQAAIVEVRDEAAGGGAPSTADFLVGTAQGGLSAEIVVGATPGGELGGTWGSPTVDATHSGSSHAGVQSAAEATAQAALDAHTADTADAHDASAISVVSTTLVGTGTDVQAVFEELDDAIVLKAPLASPTFTGTVTIPTGGSIIAPTGLVKGDVGLGNVDNIADASKAFAGSQITSGTVAEARIDSAIARDSEVAAAYQPLDADLTAIAANPAVARETTIASSATWSPNADTTDIFTVTAQAVAATTIANPSGTPVQGQRLVIRVKDDGTARALTWSGTQWRALIGLNTFLDTTIVGVTHYLTFMFNATNTKWDLVHTGTYDKSTVDFFLAAKANLNPLATDTLWGAKGDIVAATANDTAARLAVGTFGQVPTADTTETPGLIYANPQSLNDRYLSPNAARSFEALGMSRDETTDTAAPATATAILLAVALPKNFTVTRICFFSGTTAAVTPTNWWFSLCDSSFTTLRSTADQTTTAWAANTKKRISLSSTFVTTYEGVYYVAFMMKATTVISMPGRTVSSIILWGASTAPMLAVTGDAALSTAPADSTLLAASPVARATGYYAYVD